MATHPPRQSPPVSGDAQSDARDAARYRLLRQVLAPSYVEQVIILRKDEARAVRVDAVIDDHLRTFGHGG